MRSLSASILIICGLVVLGGCSKSGVAQPPAPSTDRVAPKGKPQPRLRTVKLYVGPEELVSEMAIEAEQIRMGMMFREKMAENEGMIFIFGKPHRASFWMKNTLLPLSCAYIDPEGTILEIRDMKPLDESPITAVTDQVQYVLEVNQGWFSRHKITPGMVVRTEKGSFRDTFLGGR